MRNIFKKGMLLCILLLWVCIGQKNVLAEDIIIHRIQMISDMPAVAVKVNGGGSELQKVLDSIKYQGYTEQGTNFYFAFDWDYSSVNLHQPGAYILRGTPIVPEGHKLADNITLPVFQIGVSVQEDKKPDINVYQKITAARMFYFPWLNNPDAGKWEIWIKKEGGEWFDAAKEGYALCDPSGLYLPGAALTKGNTYYMAVRGEHVASKTLKFVYTADEKLNIISYIYSDVGEEGVHSKCISSYDQNSAVQFEKEFVKAFPVGVSLTEMQEYCAANSRKLKVSTAEEYEDSVENPAIVLKAEWDFSAVNVLTSGAYKVTGTFVIPEDYTIKEDLELPKVHGYISIQEYKKPDLNIHKMDEAVITFPFLLDGFTAEEISDIKVFLKSGEDAFVRLTKEDYFLTNNSFLLERENLQNGKRYSVFLSYTDGESQVFSFTYEDNELKSIQISGRNYNDRIEEEFPPIKEETDLTNKDDLLGSDNKNDGSEEDETEGDDSEEDDILGDSSMLTYGGGGYNYSGGGSSSDSSSYSGKLSPETEKILEELSTSSMTRVSGKRLADMKNHGDDTATFEKDGISLKLTKDFFVQQKIEEVDEIQVVIQKTSDTSFSVRVFRNDTEITDIPGSVVKVPVNIMNHELIPEEVMIYDVDGAVVENSFDSVQKVLKINVEKTGDYFLRNSESAEEASFEETEDVSEVSAVLEEVIDTDSEKEKIDVSVEAGVLDDNNEPSSDNKILSFFFENWKLIGAGAAAFLGLCIIAFLFDKREK